MGSSLTAFFFKLRALLWKIACLAYLTLCLYSKGFSLSEGDKGTRGGSRNEPENTLRSGAALQQVQLRNHSDFLQNLKCGKIPFA